MVEVANVRGTNPSELKRLMARGCRVIINYITDIEGRRGPDQILVYLRDRSDADHLSSSCGWNSPHQGHMLDTEYWCISPPLKIYPRVDRDLESLPE